MRFSDVVIVTWNLDFLVSCWTLTISGPSRLRKTNWNHLVSKWFECLKEWAMSSAASRKQNSSKKRNWKAVCFTSLSLSLYFHIYDIFWSVSRRARLCWIFAERARFVFSTLEIDIHAATHFPLRDRRQDKTQPRTISQRAATTSSHFNDLWLCCFPACRLFHTPAQSVSFLLLSG